LKKTTKLANLNQFLERLHLNEFVTHSGTLAPLLNGLGASAPADGALLATKKCEVSQEEFFQLSQTEHIVIQLLIQAGEVGMGFGAGSVGVAVSVGISLGKRAPPGDLLQFFPAVLLLNAQVDESSELDVAISSSEELMLGLVERSQKVRH